MSLAEALARRRAMESGEIWASDVHDGRLWLGAGRDARNLSSLNTHSITHVLNCADDVPNCEDLSFFLKFFLRSSPLAFINAWHSL